MTNKFIGGMQKKQKFGGFTLIEILVVIGMIAILATLVIVAINPGRQFAQGRNSQRTSNVQTILNAIGQRIADNKGVFQGSFNAGGNPYTCPTLSANTDYLITSASGSGNIDLACLTPTFIPSGLPYDPTAGGAYWNSRTDYNTGYRVRLDSDGRFTVSAPGAEIGQTISITR